MASSTSVFARRRLPGLEGAVLARARDGEGSRESMRGGDSVPRLCISLGVLNEDSGRLVGSCVSGNAEMFVEGGLDCIELTLCTLERRDPEPTGFL